VKIPLVPSLPPNPGTFLFLARPNFLLPKIPQKIFWPIQSVTFSPFCAIPFKNWGLTQIKIPLLGSYPIPGSFPKVAKLPKSNSKKIPVVPSWAFPGPQGIIPLFKKDFFLKDKVNFFLPKSWSSSGNPISLWPFTKFPELDFCLQQKGWFSIIYKCYSTSHTSPKVYTCLS